MITINKSAFACGCDYQFAKAEEYRGLSTDTKPTEGVTTGSEFLEIDTGKRFCFDAENKTWYAWE